MLELIGFLGDPDFVRRRFDRYGDVFETVLAGQPQIFLKGAEAAGELLAQSEALEGWWPSTVRQLLGELSLSSCNGEAHLARRRAVGQLFTAAALRTYVPGITALCDGLVAELAAAKGPVALMDRMRPFAFAVIAQVVLGLGAAEQKALFDDFELWSGGLFSLPFAWPGTPLARAKGARKRLLRRIRSLLPSIEPLKGACDEAGQPLGDEDLVEQLLLLLFAGYETTASSLGCLLLMLLQHPEAIGWLQEEIDALPWPLAPDQLEQLERAERLDAVVKEVMRLIPPVGGLFRRTTAPVRLLGYEIPAGRVIQVNISGTHRDPRVYAVPEEFQADRHLRQPLKAPGYIPFGGGPRVCLGRPLAELEIRLLAVRLLQTLRFTLVPHQNLSLEVIPTPRPKDGLLVTVHRRSADRSKPC